MAGNQNYKINFSIINYVRRNTTPANNSVFQEIYFECGKSDEGVKMSASKLAERLPISVATVKRSLDELQELQFICNNNKGKRNSHGEFDCSVWKVNEDFILNLISTEYQNDTPSEYQNDTDNNNYNNKNNYNNYQYQNDTGCNTSNEVKEKEGFEEKNELSSNNNMTAEPKEKNNLIPSNEGIESRKAAQQELQNNFNVFLKTLKNLTVQEREKNLEYFKLEVERVYTGKWIEYNKDNLQKRYDGYAAKMKKNNPSKAKARKEAQPCNNEGIGVAAAAVNCQSLTPPVAVTPPSPYEDDFINEIESMPLEYKEEKTVTIDELIATVKSFSDKDEFDKWDVVTELSGKGFTDEEKDRFFAEFHKVQNFLKEKHYENKEVA